MGTVKDALLGGRPPPVITAPAAPPPPAPPPKQTDEEVTRARQRNRAQAALAQGRPKNILTSGLGLTSPVATAPKTVLGA